MKYLIFFLAWNIWHSYWHSYRHSIWHSFWHSIWHLFWHTFWQSIVKFFFWPSFWHSIWHPFWHSVWHSFWHSGPGVPHRIRSWRCHSTVQKEDGIEWRKEEGRNEGRKEGRELHLCQNLETLTWQVGKKRMNLGCILQYIYIIYYNIISMSPSMSYPLQLATLRGTWMKINSGCQLLEWSDVAICRLLLHVVLWLIDGQVNKSGQWTVKHKEMVQMSFLRNNHLQEMNINCCLTVCVRHIFCMDKSSECDASNLLTASAILYEVMRLRPRGNMVCPYAHVAQICSNTTT